jgi:hypothetical protein
MNDEERLHKTIKILQEKLENITQENIELRKVNKTLNSKLNLLINDADMVKNVKQDIVDNSCFYLNTDDLLKEFFYMLVLCEKMKYMNNDKIWGFDSADLYKEVQATELPFYNWQMHISNRLAKMNTIPKKVSYDCGIIEKIKYIVIT